jgi:hypothetical protein
MEICVGNICVGREQNESNENMLTREYSRTLKLQGRAGRGCPNALRKYGVRLSHFILNRGPELQFHPGPEAKASFSGTP